MKCSSAVIWKKHITLVFIDNIVLICRFFGHKVKLCEAALPNTSCFSRQRNYMWKHRKGLAKQILRFLSVVLSPSLYWINILKGFSVCLLFFFFFLPDMQCPFWMYIYSRKSLSFFHIVGNSFVLPSWCLAHYKHMKGSDCFSIDCTQLHPETRAEQNIIESLSVW